jgi:hypothetical protein
VQYLILIYTDPEADGADMQEWFDYSHALEESGAMLGGEALEDTGAAKTVRIRNGETIVTDGPFAETKEVLGGYYLIDVETMDEAVAWAAKIPSTPYGSTEVRPIMALPEM